MVITKQHIINQYLPLKTSLGKQASCFAPSNIALCKYWGKRDTVLNLPQNSSLSISLGHLGTKTTIIDEGHREDRVYLNDRHLVAENEFSQKVIRFLDLFRRDLNQPVSIYTENNIPTAAGLASSASGFAALMLCINQFYQFNLPNSILSAFARMGSGSASRSIYQGFVQWDKGSQTDGMDSIAKPLDTIWNDFAIAVLTVNHQPKKISSREGMSLTVETSPLYKAWPQQAEHDLLQIKTAIDNKSITQLGALAEQNAMTMHATMIAAFPSVLYWQPESIAYMQTVWALRNQGVDVYFTMDAGPNLKLLFTQKHLSAVKQAFSKLDDNDIIFPFQSLN